MGDADDEDADDDEDPFAPPPGLEGDDQYVFMFMQAQVAAMRTEIDEDEAEKSIKTIKKDVPRTDRKGGYFIDEFPHRMKWLHDILVTYAVFHPSVGYAQGMNDVLSMILAVTDHEADAYWCLTNYLDKIQADFMAVGMMAKLEQLKDLLTVMDTEVVAHLESIDAGDMVWCHRWLLLSFKREFEFDDAVRLFEILCSHHLELNSIEAEKARDSAARDEQEREGGQAEAKDKTNQDFTFELFVCVAILRINRDEIMKARDVADVFTFINGLVGKMNLNTVLSMAERVFFDYCAVSVTDADSAAFLMND